MDPLVFHTREIGSAQHGNRIHETVAHPKKDPIGSIGVLIFFVQEEKTFGLGMKDLALGGGDAVRNPTYAGRKIFLLSPRCPKRCAVQVSGCGRGEHVALASSWGLPMLWEEIRELAGFAVAFEQPYVMGGTSGDGQARCGARATTCYGRSSGSWRGPLWRSSLRP